MFGNRDRRDVMVRDDEGLPAVSVTISPFGREHEELAEDVEALIEEHYQTDASENDQEAGDAE